METMMSGTISEFTIESYDAVYALWKQCEDVGQSEADDRDQCHIKEHRAGA
jgi:hypothetical protein